VLHEGVSSEEGTKLGKFELHKACPGDLKFLNHRQVLIEPGFKRVAFGDDPHARVSNVAREPRDP